MTFDFEACRLDVTMEAAIRAENQHSAGSHAPDDRSFDLDLSRSDVAFDGSGGADDDRSVRREIAAKLAVDPKVTAQLEGALEDRTCIEEGTRTGFGGLRREAP
jgi:hypothetical protein